VARLGIDLTAWDNQKIMLAGKLSNLLVGPENVVIGKADTVKSQ
jgi:hypothetical protein